jgi:hypothetical protein
MVRRYLGKFKIKFITNNKIFVYNFIVKEERLYVSSKRYLRKIAPSVS